MGQGEAGLWLTAPAKVNLYLEVVGKRPDGYHDLRMFLAPISLGDEVCLRRLQRPGHIVVQVEGAPELGSGEDNLCHTAACYYFSCTGIAAGVEVLLRKRIPAGAGLGGGSSDAAVTILGLESLFGVALDRRQRQQAAFAVGADVPFFFARSAAWVGGIGEVVEPVPAFPTQWLVLVHPGAFLSTPEVFSRFNRGLTSVGHPPTIAQFNFRGFVAGLRNDLEQPATAIEPVVRVALRVLREAGAEGRLMSGSGSAVFGLLPDQGRAEAVAARVREHPEARAWRVEVVHTLPPEAFPFPTT